MKQNELFPKIRFKEFTNAWEQEKLGDLIDKGGSGGTPNTSNKGYYNGEIPFLSISDLTKTDGYIYSTEKSITKKGLNSSSAWIVPKGSITLSMYATIGKVGILGNDLATSQAFYNMVINDKTTKNYVFHFLRKCDFTNKWFKLISIGTQANLNSEKIKNFIIDLPIDQKEQSKISSLFSNLDSLITLHQRKYLALKNLKNTLLEKMFCDEKSKFPHIRFKEFTNAWEQEKLGDLIDKGGSGGTPNTSNKGYYNGEIPFLSISDLTKTDGYIYSTEKSITKKGLNSSSAWIVPKGSITLSMYATIGKVGILGNDLATSQAFYNMVINDKTTKNYVFHFLRKCDFTNKWFKLISIGTQANLNSEKIKNFIIDLPIDQKEQSKISSLFSNLDSLITLHQRKLELLKNTKNTLLDKMFV
ncbi:restriction endonuclease subunit S [Mycoplasma feriruminatoris]|uniref:Restriction endonuclease subunit S n=1 Tax=Mycoplasma feriruminatoris TaxID=1179777 RepID=A0ABY8HW41_9MOLU|nr:restriction endonuclease subunit S [Mycoplasma feriruminatoris]WFQ93846.1 restriction endonuclease subunit S [Mycoplasma feriruminatoris]